MKKMIFAAASAVLMAGCADMPKQDDGGAKEEAVVMTGSHIPRKASNGNYSNAKSIDKTEWERQVQNQGTINTPGR
ncbi:hypothetical protein [Duganella sp. Root1480D1]|uniref:hypothetical protein n=1 Tax=Duganella sp. Root1480D1 TaxID=1736471 RepID=UPI0007094A1B|nr:hypothetical protein [Duganella sp. Root1480D1]KQZ45222.1 hypothetical protein ASD58_02975 [Duganella sp. Root1480D1]